MTNNINMRLFDRLRHVGRRMRMGRTPGMITSDGEVFRKLAGDGMSKRMPGLQREMILAILKKEGITKQQDIADEFHVTKSTLSEMVNRLVEDGYVKRTDDPADRRTTVLVLTEAGDKRAEEVIEERVKVMDYMFRGLSDGEKEELIRLLDKMLGEDEAAGCI